AEIAQGNFAAWFLPAERGHSAWQRRSGLAVTGRSAVGCGAFSGRRYVASFEGRQILFLAEIAQGNFAAWFLPAERGHCAWQRRSGIAATVFPWSSIEVRDQFTFHSCDLIFQHELALLQAFQLQLIGMDVECQ